MKINSYYFEKNNIWYFRKRIPSHLSDKVKIYRRSLLKLLGKKAYYKNLLNGNLLSIANFINNNVEYFFIMKENVVLTEIDEYIKSILYKYQREATNNENGNFLDNIGSNKAEIEQMRFDSLTHYDENGKKFAGHTSEALEKEKDEVIEAYKTDRINVRKKKVNDIISRQPIFSQEEYEKIPDEYLKVFEEALLKIEVDVLDQDIKNYHAVHKSYKKPLISVKDLTEENLHESIAPEIYELIQEKKAQKLKASENRDNWDFLIDQYITKDLKSRTENTKRNAEIALTQFRHIMLGNEKFTSEDCSYKKLTIHDIQSLEEIEYLKDIFMEFPKLKTNELQTMFREKGMIYTIEFTKKDRETYPKNFLSGLNTKIKTIKKFIEKIKKRDKKKYGNLDIDLWKDLNIHFRDLSKEDQRYNIDNQKLVLMSEDLNKYLFTKYDDSKKGKQSFTKHTSSSAHIFWSIMLGIYTGARSEELAQINISRDLKKVLLEEKEIYYFDLHISDHTSQSLKNLSSRRNVPVSDYLIEMGFLNYLDSRIKAKKESLFDLSLNSDNKRKQFPRNFNDSFKLFFNEEHPNEIGKIPTFHSLRAYFVSRFMKDEKNEARYNFINLKKLIGHTTEDLHKDVSINSYYREGLEIEFSKKLIDDMDFEIDEGYEKIQTLTKEKYPNILYTLDI